MAWRYIKNKGWTDGSRVFKRKYIKLNNGDYKSLNSDGTVTLVYTNGKFTKDGQVMTSDKDKEGIRNGFVQDANAQSSYWRYDNSIKNIQKTHHTITSGEISHLISIDGNENVNDLTNRYFKLYKQNAIDLGRSYATDQEKWRAVKKEVTNALQRYNAMINSAFDGAYADNLLTSAAKKLGFTNFSDNFDNPKVKKSIAKNVFNTIGNTEFPKNWSLFQIRAAGEGKGNSQTIDRNDDYYHRLYSLKNGEKKVGDFATDTAIEILAFKGTNGLLNKATNLLGKASPKAIQTVDKVLEKTNTLGSKVSEGVSRIVPQTPKVVKKTIENVVQIPTNLLSYTVTHPISTIAEGTVYSNVYKPYYDKYAEPILNKASNTITGNKIEGFNSFLTKELIPSTGFLYRSLRLSKKGSQDLLDNVVTPKVKLSENGLAKTYQNDWVSGTGSSGISGVASSPYSQKVANIINPAKESILYGVPLSIAQHYNVNPGTFVEKTTGSQTLGNIADFAIAGYVGNKLNQKIARTEYLRGNGATNLEELGNGIKQGYTINENGKQTDPISYWLSQRSPKAAAIYRMSASYLPHNFLSPTGHYTGLFKGFPGVSTKNAAQFIKGMKFSSNKDAMVSSLSKEHSLQGTPGGIAERKVYIAGSSTKHLDPVERDALEQAFSLGRFKKGQVVDLTFSGDWKRFAQGVKDGTIVPMRGGVDENGDFIPLFDEKGNPSVIGKHIIGRQGAIPVGSAGKYKTGKDYLYYFDTQGHLVDLWYDTKTKEVLYRSMDNSGLGRASRSSEGQNALTTLKQTESAFVDLNQRQAFNVNINGGPSAIGGKGKKIVEAKPQYTSLKNYREDNPFDGDKTKGGKKTKEYLDYLSKTKSQFEAQLNKGGRGEWKQTTMKHLVSQLFPWNPAKMTFKQYQSFIEDQAYQLAEHSAFGSMFPTEQYLDNYKRKLSGDKTLPKEALIDSQVGPLTFPTREILKQIKWITD